MHDDKGIIMDVMSSSGGTCFTLSSIHNSSQSSSDTHMIGASHFHDNAIECERTRRVVKSHLSLLGVQRGFVSTVVYTCDNKFSFINCMLASKTIIVTSG